jgi:hypothetical protein
MWSAIERSNRVIGGSIWAALDEPFYFANGKKAGYAWVHGFWGVIDAWRRPKPEWWLSKLIFSPIWFPTRQVPFAPDQRTVRIPVENRYAFTNLSDLHFSWELDGKSGRAHTDVPPASRGEITLAVPPGTRPGSTLFLRVTGADRDIVTVLGLHLGPPAPVPVPGLHGGAPRWADRGATIDVDCSASHLSLDRATARFLSDVTGSAPPVLEFPVLHVTQYDFGDLGGPFARPYAVLPDPATRTIEAVAAVEKRDGLDLTVHDRYAGFAGWVRWRIDRSGMGRVAYDYVYSGPDMSAREIGIRFLLRPDCDEVKWKRWSEWDLYPKDDVSRTEGTARARRDPKWGSGSESTRPTWPWSQDQTELGTSDFRSIKFNIYHASVTAPDGSGLQVYANADAHVRPCLDPAGVKLHVLSQCGMAPVILKSGDRISGELTVGLSHRAGD